MCIRKLEALSSLLGLGLIRLVCSRHAHPCSEDLRPDGLEALVQQITISMSKVPGPQFPLRGGPLGGILY